ncbi:hypothetical protein QGN32_05510 [Mycolicibacterium sp. ND9-15]|uniref:hypothetical protein n=1 Tax=Mycolicibacterium sp. ND9-15 TaxID=3042320 RepID=UPI002DD877EF|nr:hypothetical protein [Mycolicibacterium sp. ND9-15]WSE57353.1 hypothetical protein QGN32_05510 [Mycolicibacterium sp. ND9-15]
MSVQRVINAPVTLVRETWDVSEDRQRLILTAGAMPRQIEDGMRATLERIAALVEP